MIDPVKFALEGRGPKNVSVEKFELKIPPAHEGCIFHEKFIIDITNPAFPPESPHYNKGSFNPFILVSSGIYAVAGMAEAETGKTGKAVSLYK
jgi:hypothetical protein